MPTCKEKRSRFRVVTWIAIVFTLVVSFMLATPMTARASEPPMPDLTDRCGTDQDEFVVEDNGFGYFADQYGNDWYMPGTRYSTDDRLSVIVYVDDYAGGAMQMLTLVFTDEPCPLEANNVYSAAVAECTGSENPGETPLSVTVHNVADATGYAIPKITLVTTRVSDGDPGLQEPVVMENILDGEVRTAQVKDYAFTGLPHGTWNLDFMRDGVRVARVRMDLHGCLSPDPDPDPDPPPVVKPTAQLIPVFTRGDVAVKVRLDNRKVAKANVFKIQRVYKTRVVKVVKTRVARYSTAVKWFYHIRKGTRIKVFYKTPSGWKRILSELVENPGGS